MKLALALFLGLALFGCGGSDGGGDSDESRKLNATEYLTVDQGTLVHSGVSVGGTGSIVAKAPLASIGSKTAYALAFTLEDGGSLTLVSNASATLTGGVELKVTRKGDKTEASLAAGAAKDVSAAFATVSPTATITLTVDVHNDEAPAHVLAWSGAAFTEDDAILNSEDEGLATPGSGAGTYWGLVLAKAVVTSAEAGAPKFSE